MGKKSNELVQFIIGLVMLVSGGYAFLSSVHVSSGFTRLRFGGVHIGSGLVVIPFIIGIIMLFAMPRKFISKLVTGLGLLVIIISVIMSTDLYLTHLPLFAYLLMFIGIFGGVTLILKILLANPDRFEDEEEETRPIRSRKRRQRDYEPISTEAEQVSDVDEEMEALKKKYLK